MNNDSEMMEITSLIMFSCFEFMMVGKFISTICRVFFDNQLSTVLIKLESIHEKLIQLNVVRPIIIKIDWFTAVGILGINLYFSTYNMSMFFWYRYKSHSTNTLFNLRLMVIIIIYIYFISNFIH